MPATLQNPTLELATDLQLRMRGEVRTDPLSRTLYATDASIYEIEPLAVVYPLDEADVVACVKFAAEKKIPLIARGAGSGLTGEALGRGIVLDMSVHMHSIIEFDAQKMTVHCESGVVLASLNRALKPSGVTIGPDPSSGNRCTLGGMIANNACGARSLKYGATRENLISARVVFADGSVANLRQVELNGTTHERKKQAEGIAGKLHRELPALIAEHADIFQRPGHRAERDRCGYLLKDIVRAGCFDPVKLICASEGTLGIVTECVMRVHPLPKRVGVAVVLFDRLPEAGYAVPAIRETLPVACELYDALLMKLARQARPEKAHLLPADAGAMLVIEYEGDTLEEVYDQIRILEARLQQGVRYRQFRPIPDAQEQYDLWEMRKAAVPLLFRREDGLQPIAIVEDAAVPVDRLGEYIEKLCAVFDRFGLEYSGYAHAGHGEPHFRPMLDLRKKEYCEMLEPLAEACHEVVWACEGTISGEHGEGLARAQWIPRQAGAQRYEVYKTIKRFFDPQGLLNPDKKIADDPHLMLKHQRLGSGFAFSGDKSTPLGPNRLTWDRHTIEEAVIKCNGCAQCRSTGPDVEMCPRYKYHRYEDASPRAKANILRRLLSGRDTTTRFEQAEMLETMELCFNCKLCEDDCPSGVHIPKMVMEAKARYHSTHALPLSKKMFVFSEAASIAGRLLAPFVNRFNRWKPARWIMEQMLGIDRRRALPEFKSFAIKRLDTPEAKTKTQRPQVVLYIDLYAKYNAPEIAQAAVSVLEHHGYQVLLPEIPWTNMPALLHGDVPAATAQIRKVTTLLDRYAAEGIPILSTEPTATLCLKKEYKDYVDAAQVERVAQATRDLGEFLLDLYKRKLLKTDFRPVPLVLGYHAPCHLKALHIGKPALQLLQPIPELQVKYIDRGCCGIAGTFGMTRKNYDESMWIGKGLFQELKDTQIDFGLSECSTCQMQMAHGSEKPAIHPIQILSVAYGYIYGQPKWLTARLAKD